MNWLDVVLGLILSLSFIAAAWNGLSREVIRLLALGGGIVAGMWWYEDLAIHLRPYVESAEMASFAAFLSIVVGSIVAGAIVARMLGKLLHWTGPAMVRPPAGRGLRFGARTSHRHGGGLGRRGLPTNGGFGGHDCGVPAGALGAAWRFRRNVDGAPQSANPV